MADHQKSRPLAARQIKSPADSCSRAPDFVNGRALFGRNRRQIGKRGLQCRFVIVAVFEVAGEIIHIGLHIEVAVARQVEEDRLCLTGLLGGEGFRRP